MALSRHVLGSRALASLNRSAVRLQFRLTSNEPLQTPYRCPTIKDAERLPRSFQELPSDILCLLAYQDVPEATRERLVREVMFVDQVDWQTASQKVEVMDAANDRWAHLLHLPHQVGLAFGVFGALVSVPMVFHKPTAIWFNDNFVSADPPEGGMETIETVFEVGSWTWSWMEPVLGTLSFLLLGLQFARANMQNMHIKPYTAAVKELRARILAKKYPQYNEEIVKAFAKLDDFSIWGRPGLVHHHVIPGTPAPKS